MCGWWHLKRRTRCEALSRRICVYSDSIFSNGLTAHSYAIIYCCSSHSISRSISSYWLKRTLLKKIAIYCANISHPQKCWPAGLYKSVKHIHCTKTTTFSGPSYQDISSLVQYTHLCLTDLDRIYRVPSTEYSAHQGRKPWGLGAHANYCTRYGVIKKKRF